MSARRMDIGIASYGNPEKLRTTIKSVIANSRTDWRLIIVDNTHPNADTNSRVIEVLRDAKNELENKLHVEYLLENRGYAGAVKYLQENFTSEYLAYLDNDVEIHTPGWDEILCSYLDRFHEIGMMFPNSGPYPINRGAYNEVLWGVGFSWIASRLCMSEVGTFDTTLGHQEEADYAQRVRMAGWKCATCLSPFEVQISHHATATNNPASIERISKGVVNWVNKWNRYFNGKNFNYHSTNVTRFEDWPPNALYLEEYWKSKLPGLNSNPEVVTLDGREYDLIKVPRLKGFYTGRII